MRMLSMVIMLALAALLVGSQFAHRSSAGNKEEADKKEIAALQGTWQCLRFEEGGKLVETKGAYVIDGHKISVDWGNGILKARMSTNASKEPKHLDLENLDTGRTDVTIYVRAGDYLIQCGNRDGKTRPTKFATGVEGGGEYIIVWKIRR
jgi:uncharacterized protein (TIGR03067 family)